ncbi:hypothetical protein [Hymenobacter sp. BT491]|uniref:hypothetical protein n=1 Tax=Hymenobacter sp. BT491 TaxID=2766779 RepID=UPI001653E7F2|nr:hypothetical protein [Hymenobacter sp. BT491]MBC6989484.1 hypothetical protein [Hymenobacter sp. BT491]
MPQNINNQAYKESFKRDGYAILPDLYSSEEVLALVNTIESAPTTTPNFRRSQDLFAIRNLLHEIPDLAPLLWTVKLRQLLYSLFNSTPQLVKATYFDKPAKSNWLVAWHQDLMISVDRRQEIPGFGPWTNKQGDVAVQPTREILWKILSQCAFTSTTAMLATGR